MKSAFVMISVAGPQRDLTRGTREQAHWDEHAQFVDALVEREFIMMGGPFEDEGDAMLIVRADDAHEVMQTMKGDPWLTHGILRLQSIKRWEIYIDTRE